MKKLLFPLVIYILWGCCGPQKVIVLNKHEFDVSCKLVTIEKDLLTLVEQKLPTITGDDGTAIPSQLVDSDDDGSWDQLIFQVTVKAKSNSEFIVDWVSEDDYPKYPKQTQVYLGYSESRDNIFRSVDRHTRTKEHLPQKVPYTYQFEGPGWESNLVAFRSYFDTRNGKDIFGKRTEEMVVHMIGTGENYHSLQSWGMDVLKVGSSLGAGGLAIFKSDSLLRLGETATAEFVKVQEGPILSSFKLIYKGWDVLGLNYELQEEIVIQANKRWFQSTVSLSAVDDQSTDTLAVGIVNLKEARVDQINQAGVQALYTYGIQSENKDALGMALFIEDKYFLTTAIAPSDGNGITNSELAYLKPGEGSFIYHFYAGWEMENSKFSSREGFEDALKTTAQELSADLVINIQ